MSAIVVEEQPIQVLQIEDNIGDVILMREMLANSTYSHYKMTHAGSMREAEIILEQQDFDVLLLDLRLPDSDGLNSIEVLQRYSHDKPIVILTGSNSEGMALQAAVKGAQDYLVKGQFNAALLTRSINYAIHRNKTECQLKQLAHYDALTGLANRYLFDDRLEQAVFRCHRSRDILALIFLDLDNFKPVNDKFGHATGDLVLKEVADRLTACVREQDTVARVGGDEFSIILEGLHREHDVRMIAQNVMKKLAFPYRMDDCEVVPTASLGVALYDGVGSVTVGEFVRRADAVMYEAKQQGGNRYEVYCANFAEHVEPCTTDCEA